MTWATVDANGKITNSGTAATLPNGAIDASGLSPYLIQSQLVTWNGTAWIIGSVSIESITAAKARLKTYMSNNGFTPQQATTMITVLEQLVSILT